MGKIRELTRKNFGFLPEKLPGTSTCVKIEQDPAFPAGKSGIFKNPDRKTGKKLNPGGVSEFNSGILPGNWGTLRFPPVFPGFHRRDLTGKTGKFKIPASTSGIYRPGFYRGNWEI